MYKTNSQSLKTSLLKIALVTATAILIVKTLNTLLVYHFFTFDKYLAIVAICFLIIGYFLAKKDQIISFSSQVAFLQNSFSENEKLSTLKNARYSLTNREIDVFRYIAKGFTNKEIAHTLSIGVSTVKTHTNNLFAKLNCNNRKQAIEKWDELVKNQFIS
jgi:DNA-binding CsgD family transcriptional regulator